jgi:two-component system, OmpR family, clock-associated histidine kinase SasA
MLEKEGIDVLSKSTEDAEAILQLLLFVDKRPSSAEKIRQVRSHLKSLRAEYPFSLQVIDVSEQPHLAEHFRLVATPTLIKLHPEPRQTLAGSNLVSQIENWWVRWQRSAEEYATRVLDDDQGDFLQENGHNEKIQAGGSVAYSAELIRLSDEIFRLKQEKEELHAQLRFKDRLIAMLAHDLRNPLTAVSIALETIEIGNSSAETASRITPTLMAQLIKHARTQAKTIDRMITNVLQAARSEGAGFQVDLAELNLAQLCHEILARLEPQFTVKSQHLRTDIPGDLPHVYADAERIQQVLVNLLDNAMKYTPVGGTIGLSVLHRTTQKVQVSICDNGPGIPEENRERIFEDRFRLKRDEEKEGYGIGLSLCQRIIRAHYGQIWVDSTPDRGSCFHFTLPVYR